MELDSEKSSVRIEWMPVQVYREQRLYAIMQLRDCMANKDHTTHRYRFSQSISRVLFGVVPDRHHRWLCLRRPEIWNISSWYQWTPNRVDRVCHVAVGRRIPADQKRTRRGHSVYFVLYRVLACHIEHLSIWNATNELLNLCVSEILHRRSSVS